MSELEGVMMAMYARMRSAGTSDSFPIQGQTRLVHGCRQLKGAPAENAETKPARMFLRFLRIRVTRPSQ